SNPVVRPEWEAAKAAALSLGIELYLLDVRNSQAISRALGAEIRRRADALLVSLDGLIQENQANILDLVASRQLPAMFPSREFVEGGGLVPYGVSYPPLYSRGREFCGQNLQGREPRRPAGGATNQDGANHKSQDGEDARAGGAPDAARPRRRGDRVM